MAGKFQRILFAKINLEDPFFDSLKKDYPEFVDSWFPKCIAENREALVFTDEQGLGAFIAMKNENEEIQLVNKTLPMCPRLKVSTFLLAERFRGQRLGEGAIGLVLWDWQHSKLDEIYLTVFPQHDDLISQLERFGFVSVGSNRRGELVYLRSRKSIDYTDSYKAFPFISPEYGKGGYLIIEDTYHDTLFPYSELKNTLQEKLEIDAANGVSKIYVGNQWQVHYGIGEPVFIYRKFCGEGGKRYRSCLTSYCVVTSIQEIKRNGLALISFEKFCKMIGNKSVFPQDVLHQKYQQDRNLTIIQLLYYGYFGSGNNVNMDWLDKNGLWSPLGEYPANTKLTPNQCEMIWQEGGIDINNILGR